MFLSANGNETFPRDVHELPAHHAPLSSCRFWPDLVASVPVSLLLQGSSEGIGSINKVLRLVRIFKLFRVFRMARFLKNLEELAIVNPSSIRLMGLVVSYFYLLHLFACIYWFFLTSKGGDDGRGSILSGIMELE